MSLLFLCISLLLNKSINKKNHTDPNLQRGIAYNIIVELHN